MMVIQLNSNNSIVTIPHVQVQSSTPSFRVSWEVGVAEGSGSGAQTGEYPQQSTIKAVVTEVFYIGLRLGIVLGEGHEKSNCK